MSQVNDAKYAALLAQTGLTEGHIDDLERVYLTQQTGLNGHNNDLWMALFKQNGATSDHFNDAAVEFLENLGAPPGHINDQWFYFWDVLSGGIGPTVIIQRNNDPGFCEFEPPATLDCSSSETYTANDTNFTNPANTWLWTLEPPVAGVTLTNATPKTCTVTTDAASTDYTYNLKVVATDSVSTDSAERTNAYTQRHIDANEPPVFIGPPVNDVIFAQNVDIGTFDFSVLFTGTNLVYSEVGTLPAGLSLDANTGVLTGTPTGVEAQSIAVRVTNSQGTADTNTFLMTITNQSQVLSVDQVTPGSCEYPPGGTCQADGTYIANDSGWTLPPDTYVWEATAGSATIISGQGTSSVVVRTDAGSDTTFSLKCSASNSGGESAENVSQFTRNTSS